PQQAAGRMRAAGRHRRGRDHLPCRPAARDAAQGPDVTIDASRGSTWARWVEAAQVYRSRKQLILLMGFSSGAPFLLTGAVLSTWMGTIKVDLTTIGLFALVGTPYAFKFVWAPFVDRAPLPVLDGWLGRRRSWMLLSQTLLLGAVLWLAWSDPV